MAGVSGYFTVPDQYAGKSLTQIQQQSGQAFRPDVLGGMLGINPNTALTSGQSLGFNGNLADNGSGEVQAANSIFGSPTSPAMKDAADANNFTIKANQPYIQQLQGQQSQTGSAYQSIIDDILNAGKTAQNKNTVTLSKEYGMRGIPMDSTMVQQDLNNSNSTVNQPYLAQADTATGNKVNALNSISSAIGQLQAGSPASAISAGLSQTSMANQNQLAQEQMNLNQSQQAFNQRYVTTPFGIYDLSTGRVLAGFNASNSGGSSGTGQILGTY